MDELAPGGVPSEALRPLISRGSAEVSGRPLRVRWLALLGDVLWDVFSNNNDVVGPNGELYDLGSFRGSGGFIAGYLNDRLQAEAGDTPGQEGGRPFDYLDFYMGTLGLFGGAADEKLGLAFYARVFERLREQQCDWHYAPPSIGLVRIGHPEEENEAPERYDPGAALAAEAEQDEEEKQLAEFARQLAEANAEAFERAVREPPLVVRAYREVYGQWPTYVHY
jgi:hypothetical protein